MRLADYHSFRYFSILSKIFHLLYAGSQIVADRKKEFASQVRNELIDKKALLLDSKLTPVQKDIDVDGLSNNRRRNSFDTFSTDIEIEENADESEVSEDLGKKPRWHPPWQLKQVIHLQKFTRNLSEN